MADSEIRVLYGIEAVIERPHIYLLNQTMEEVIAWCYGYQSGAGYEPHCPYSHGQITAYLEWLNESAEKEGYRKGKTFAEGIRQVFSTDEVFFKASRRFLKDYRTRVSPPPLSE